MNITGFSLTGGKKKCMIYKNPLLCNSVLQERFDAPWFLVAPSSPNSIDSHIQGSLVCVLSSLCTVF